MTTNRSSQSIYFGNSGRVEIRAIPHDQLWCISCRRRINTGEGLFVEIDSDRNCGVDSEVICGPCMAEALRPRNVISANWEKRG